MFLTVRRRDKVWVSLNLDHVTYAYPEAPVPGDYAVVVLASGEQIRLSHTFSDYVDMVERRMTERLAAPPMGSGVLRPPAPRPTQSGTMPPPTRG